MIKEIEHSAKPEESDRAAEKVDGYQKPSSGPLRGNLVEGTEMTPKSDRATDDFKVFIDKETVKALHALVKRIKSYRPSVSHLPSTSRKPRTC